jgi:TetR/AcrR family transcriptional regulator of autoinduction and epiphytic fitness
MTTAPPQSKPAPAPTGRVERKRAQKRRDILIATAEVLSRDGYHAMNMDDIAERVDLTKATLYHYYNSKDELVSACLSLVADEVNTRLERIAVETQSLPAIDRLRALVTDQLTILLIDYPEGGKLFSQPHDWPHEQSKLLRTHRKRHDTVFREVVSIGIQSGELRSEDENVALHCLYGAINYMSVWARPASNAAARRLIETTCNILVQSFT